MTSYAFENLFRTPWEFMVSSVSAGFGVVCLTDHTALGLDVQLGPLVAAPFLALALMRGWQGFKIRHFRKRLLVLKPFALSIPEIPASDQHMYLGKGFKWLPMHRQRMSLLSQLQNQRFMQKHAVYRYIQARARENPYGLSASLTQLKWLPFKPSPDIGGKPWIHGVGSDNERPIFINQANRNQHECVFGMTRVGKTRYMAIKVIQDIKNGEAVLVIDPKGDLDVLKDIFCAAAASGRLNDLKILHLGFPELSAKYNPLSSVSNVSEVASRITGAMSASGEGKQFKDFAWTYLNIVAQCLYELSEPINYKTMGFYIKRPEILMLEYVDRVFPKVEPGYMSDVQAIIDEHDSRVDKEGNPVLPMKRSMAIKRYLTTYIEGQAASGSSKQLMDSIVVPLYNAAMLDKTYYDKITASVGPVLDKINQTQAVGVFSWDNAFGLPEIRLEDVIKRKQIVYIGLDSLTNREMAEAVGQAIIADLVSLCGRLYSTSSGATNTLNLYCDEFSNIVRDEFVGLLNKAGGAGIRVTALTQTVNDLGAALGGSGDKAKMLLGNFGTMTMLRVSNEDTAFTLSRCLETIKTRSTTPSTSTSDRAEPVGGELFGTSNTDIVTEGSNALIEVNDLFSLPKGQAFVLTNGGEVYKIRIPLSKNDGSAPETFEAILSEVNLCF